MLSTPKTMFEKIWDAHVVRHASSESTILYIDRHLVHEATSPQAFAGLRAAHPFGQNIEGLHPSEIKLGFIGTRETVAGAKEWIKECSAPIESNNIRTFGRSSQQSGEGLFGTLPD